MTHVECSIKGEKINTKNKAKDVKKWTTNKIDNPHHLENSRLKKNTILKLYSQKFPDVLEQHNGDDWNEFYDNSNKLAVIFVT